MHLTGICSRKRLCKMNLNTCLQVIWHLTKKLFPIFKKITKDIRGNIWVKLHSLNSHWKYFYLELHWPSRKSGRGICDRITHFCILKNHYIAFQQQSHTYAGPWMGMGLFWGGKRSHIWRSTASQCPRMDSESRGERRVSSIQPAWPHCCLEEGLRLCL